MKNTETCWITWPVTDDCRGWLPRGWPFCGCELPENHHGAHTCRCGGTLDRVRNYVPDPAGDGYGGRVGA